MVKKLSIPKCTHCNKNTDKNQFCYGCKTYVCDNCEVAWSVAAAGFGGHAPEDHLEKAEEEEEEEEE